MRKLAFVCIVALALSTTTMAVEIAISTQGGWMGQGTADAESQEIVDNVTGAPIEVFTSADLDDLADWVEAHTGDGVPDLLVMFGIFPDTIYPAGNAQPDGSLAELFLDDGNCIINTGDYIFYVGSAANNDAGGLANMTDVPAAAMWGDDSLATIFTPTADGQLYTPSLPALASNRPWFPAQFEGTDWYFELILAQSDDGTQVHPGILRNSVTGGRLGVFSQISDDSQPRGEVISEWINNWYLPMAGKGELSSDPLPADGAVDIPRDVVLEWSAGNFAASHDVYLGTVREDVNNASRADPMGVLVSQGQPDTAYDPDGLLDFETTYYWRVDEVNAAPDNTIFKGDLWSFTTEPFAYPITNVAVTTNATSEAGAGPENTINGSGLNDMDQHSIESTDMWLANPSGADPVTIQYEFDGIYKMHEMLVWNYNVQFELILGFGLKDVTIEYSEDGENWTALGDVELAQATAQPTYTANTMVDFQGVPAKFVRLTVNSGYGMMGQYGLSEVRFMYIPALAREPQPADGATNVTVDAQLAWRAGRDATTHEVYLGTDAEALELAGTPSNATFDPGALNLDTVYYWKVDEASDATWEGNLWSFATQAYLVVDDFESYDDEENTIFDTWIDGFINETGSTVGYFESPFAEQTIVHGGRQSMPLEYNNTGVATSEADLDVDGQDWTANGIKSLSLYFCGNLDNSSGQLYVKINNTRIDYDGDAADLGIAGWQKWNIVLADTGANLNNVTTLTVGVEGAGAQGIVYIDDIRLSPQVSAPRTSDIGIAISAQANWWSQDAADREMEEIVNNAQAPVVVFDAGSQDGLADWLSDHTSNGVANLLILCGQLPDTIYEPGNGQADDSIVEQFLDAGNTIINTGDWIFYVVNGAGTNGAAGLQTIMDIPAVTVAGGDNTAVTVTAEGQELTPSLQGFATDRPFHLDTLEGDWYAELILAQNADGILVDPVIVRNSATGGRIGIFHQAANEDDLPRGEVISEWINNWYLDAASGGN
jgi:hypothetical protein